MWNFKLFPCRRWSNLCSTYLSDLEQAYRAISSSPFVLQSPFCFIFIFTYSPYDSQLCPAHSSRWPACHSSTARWAARDNQELSLEKSKPVRAGGLWETIQEGDLKWVCAKVCEYANDQTMGAPGLKPWLQHCHTWASIQASTWLVEPPVPDMINDSEPTTSHGPRKLFTTKPRLFCL